MNMSKMKLALLLTFLQLNANGIPALPKIFDAKFYADKVESLTAKLGKWPGILVLVLLFVFLGAVVLGIALALKKKVSGQ